MCVQLDLEFWLGKLRAIPELGFFFVLVIPFLFRRSTNFGNMYCEDVTVGIGFG